MEGGPDSSAQAPIVYCLLPRELARFHDHLRRHYRDDPVVEVVVERRGDERRSARERRRRETAEPKVERRRIRGAGGRRVAERRAAIVAVEARELPRKLRAHAAQIRFVERLEPAGLKREDIDTARLVTRIQAGDGDKFALLYTRYFDRIYAYLRVLLKSATEAEDATQQIFTQVFCALPRYELRDRPFRAWLFAVARNHAIDELKRSQRIQPEDPAELDRRREQPCSESSEVEVPSWLSDRDLVVFVERLPLAQRQVLLLRYMLDLSNAQVADVMGRKPSEIKVLHHRALRFLNARLTALGRTPDNLGKVGVRRRFKQAGVLRARRFALMP